MVRVIFTLTWIGFFFANYQIVTWLYYDWMHIRVEVIGSIAILYLFSILFMTAFSVSMNQLSKEKDE